jgi:aminoglycoside phosphotransferase (APT) family kinase protein
VLDIAMINPQIDVKHLVIDEMLVRGLVDAQFPHWAGLPIQPVAAGGWNNKTFHLGNHMLVRLPSAAGYAAQVEKEQRWLPILAPLLPLPIPTPLALGTPANGYPWKWSIYEWIDGEVALPERIIDLHDFATRLARFLAALQGIDTADGPGPGLHNFYRGGPLLAYDAQARQAIAVLKDKIDVDAATEIWNAALTAIWHGKLVWVHGDVSLGNLLVRGGRLSAVIDFGILGVGDPACDLAIAWTLFQGDSRDAFRATLKLDADTWARGRGWTLWKALILAAGLTNSNAIEAVNPWRIIDEVIADHRRSA